MVTRATPGLKIMSAVTAAMAVAVISACGTPAKSSHGSRPSAAPSRAACQPVPQDAKEAIAHGARHGESTLRLLGGGVAVKQADGSVLERNKG